MRSLADRVSTVVLVMMENRSFDHMLGHLSLAGLLPVEGLKNPLTNFKSLYGGSFFCPYPGTDEPMSVDPDHEWDHVATQLHWSDVRQAFDMDGFVESYVDVSKAAPLQQCEVMAYMPSSVVPITSWLAQNFLVCDHWHCPLPSSTQPNRTMAFCGSSEIFDTGSPRLIPTQDILFDWLNRNGVNWRCYHDGLSFFALYPRAWDHVLGERFRDFESYFHDMQTESVKDGPQVIVVEPSYYDAPHLGSDHPNDNHPPLAVGWGEEFLRRVYQAASVNPERWAGTVMVYYYDEHGAFYDHVPPPRIPYTTRGNPSHAFDSLGPRIPAVVVSPLVNQGSVSSDLFDHTSVLQLLAERFTPGSAYSPDVAARAAAGIKSLSIALGDSARHDVPLVPSVPIQVRGPLGAAVRLRPSNGMQASFEVAAEQMMVARQAEMQQRYPELFQWKASVDALRRDPRTKP
jgi:phospholipase C